MGQILTLNTGSSSIKASIYETYDNSPIFKILLTGIGADQGLFSVESQNIKEKKTFKTHKEAFTVLSQWIKENKLKDHIQFVGHRLVHGGPKYREPVLITPEVFTYLQSIIPYDPLHIPPELEGVSLIRNLFPNVPQAACFDTAFHQTLPDMARVFALPYSYTEEGIFRYGFHGLSFESVIDVLKEKNQLHEKIIIAHLGSGCSMAAVKKGKSIDTTMGFTSTGGLIMGSRTGDLDPGILTYLLSEKKLDAKKLCHIINFESGLKGISEKTSEMTELLKSDDEKAKLAIACFCYQIKKTIGAYFAALGGLDLLVFTGGIGENSEVIRTKICQDLAFLDLKVQVIQANEEKMIAKHTQQVLSQHVNQRG